MENSLTDLHLKFADKSWNETFQIVRRCMDKPRGEPGQSEPVVRSLETLQEVCNVPSLNSMKSHLETITSQQGMGFHITDTTCYLTADLFYLEVVLLPSGEVEDVKVASHGRSPVRSETLLQMLRSHQFTEFSTKLAGLYSHYNIPGENEIKLKLFVSLQCLGGDLQKISNLPPVKKDRELSHVDIFNNSRIGRLIAENEDSPLTLQFYVSPAEETNASNSRKQMLIRPWESMNMADPTIQTALVTLVTSDVNHCLQMASVLPRPPQLDPQGHPVFLPPSESLCETLPACFLLKLQPAIPMMKSSVEKLVQITDVTIPDADLQWAPFPKLLMTSLQSVSSQEGMTDEQDAVFQVSLPGGVMHSCVLPGSVWKLPSQRGVAVDCVPFTHPAQVQALVELLRRQCVVNVLLGSCLTSRPGGAGSAVSDLHYEVRPESDSSFSVTFRRPDADSLAVLLVSVSDSHQISCTLFGAGLRDPSVDEYLSTVMMRCMSVPGTMMALNDKLDPIPASPHQEANAESEREL
ncbi:mediator of RNA polymerase II transcription subunit 1-like [Antennarius striatus]|uniref:mediator of RNA polymerase II transcription subunit 1-like n=1 Tax=Antennarius striatus TaxID=241820 RepID=UPI0035B07485